MDSITDRGRPVAHLVPIHSADPDKYLAAAGLLAPAPAPRPKFDADSLDCRRRPHGRSGRTALRSVIYLDTSAMVKLVAAEPESAELIDWLNNRAEGAVDSAIGHIELVRAARRNAGAPPANSDVGILFTDGSPRPPLPRSARELQRARRTSVSITAVTATGY